MIDYITDRFTTDSRLCRFIGRSQGLNKDYDLKFDLLNKVTKTITFEIKTDKKGKTNNVFFEKSCRGIPSGITSSKSDYFIYFLPRRLKNNLYFIKTENLKHILTTTFKHCINYDGGDGGRVISYLIYTDDFNEEFVRYGGEIITLDVDIPSEFNLTKF